MSHYGVFTLSNTDSNTDSDDMQKGYTGTEIYGNPDAKWQRKLVKFHLISTKLGAVAIRIRIGMSVGSVETVLHIIIESIFL